jgi:hypothetical protein
VVVQYAGQPNVIWKLAGRPLDEQQMVLDGVIPALPPPKPPNPAAQHSGPRLKVPAGTPDAGRDQNGEAADADDDGTVDLPPDDGPKLGVAGMAARGSPRDVGDMAAELILNCRERATALNRLVDRLVLSGAMREQLGNMIKAASLEAPKRKPFWSKDDEG